MLEDRPGPRPDEKWIDRLAPKVADLREALGWVPADAVAQLSGAVLEGESLRLSMLFEPYLIDTNTYVVRTAAGPEASSFIQALVLTYLHTADGINQYQGSFGSSHRSLRIEDEGTITGCVQQVDFVPPPFTVRYGGVNRDLPLDFIIFIIRGRGTIFNPPKTIHCPCRIEEGTNHGCLPCVAVSYDDKVADSVTIEFLHQGSFLAIT